jgi:DNA-binding transcriptional regulator LsrR (DeoR family)
MVSRCEAGPSAPRPSPERKEPRMAKKARTSATVQDKVERTVPGARGRKNHIQPDLQMHADVEIELDRMERLAAVCELFCKGHTVREILGKMEERFGEAGIMRREDPYTLISYAASRGWLEFRAPHHLEFAHFLRNQYSWLEDVDVVRTAVAEDVARRGAQMLLRIVKEEVRRHPEKKDVVRVGFAGGVAVSHLASAFADLLCRPTKGLPKKIVFHSIVAGFSPTDPSTDPNAFFTYFMNKPLMQVEPEFLGLHAPAIVKSADLHKILRQRDIEIASTWAKKLDVVVTSGSDWGDPDSLLAREMRTSDVESYEKLQRLGVEGDVMWRPLSASCPIDAETVLRALTMKELTDLPAFIRGGGSVLLMMGPCAGCARPKGRITKIILDLPESIVTHVVLDSRTAAQMMKELGGYKS